MWVHESASHGLSYGKVVTKLWNYLWYQTYSYQKHKREEWFIYEKSRGHYLNLCLKLHFYFETVVIIYLSFIL